MVNRRGKTSASTRNKIQQFVFEWSLDRTEVCLICISIASSSPCVLLLKWNKRSLDGKITAKFFDQKLKSWMFEKPVNQLGWWFSLLCYLSRKFSLIIDWCVIYSLLHALKGLLNTIVIAESVSRLLNESRTTKLVSVSHIFDQWTYLSMVMYSVCPILLSNIWSRGIVLTATWINTMSLQILQSWKRRVWGTSKRHRSGGIKTTWQVDKTCSTLSLEHGKVSLHCGLSDSCKKLNLHSVERYQIQGNFLVSIGLNFKQILKTSVTWSDLRKVHANPFAIW